MRKLYFLMLFALLAIGVNAETQTIVFDATSLPSVESGDLTISFSNKQGGNSPAFNQKDNAIRAYIKNTATVSVKNDGLITSIILNDLGFDKTTNTLTPNVGTFDEETNTWSGNTSEVIFTTTDKNNGGSGHAKYRSMEITYTKGIQTKVDAPEFELAPGTYYEAQTVTLTCATKDATIKYTINGGSEQVYTEEGIALTETGDYAIEAWAEKADLESSAKVSATYKIEEMTEGEKAVNINIAELADANGWTNAMNLPSFSANGVSFEATDGSDPCRYYDGGTWRIYAGATLTVSVPDGATLSKIVFTYEGSRKGGNVTITTGNYANDVWQKTTATQSVSFTFSEQARIMNMEVTFAVGDVPETKCATPVYSLTDGSVFYEPQTLTFTCSTEGATIKYTINGGEEQEYIPGTSEPIALDEYMTYNFSAYTTKEGLANSETIAATYEIKQVVEVGSIAEFMEKGVNGDMMRFTCPLTVTFVTFNRETTFVKDAEGSEIQIYGKTGQKYEAGSVIPAGVMGKYELYKDNTPEIKDILTASFQEAEASEEVVPSAIKANALTVTDVNKLVSLENVTIADSGNGNYTLTDETGSVTAYHNKQYMAEDAVIPTDAKKYDVTGIVNVFNGQAQLYPTAIVEHTSSGIENALAKAIAIRTTAEGIAVDTASECEVSVFNAAGQAVASATATDGLNTIHVPAGFYIVKAGGTVAKVIVK